MRRSDAQYIPAEPPSSLIRSVGARTQNPPTPNPIAPSQTQAEIGSLDSTLPPQSQPSTPAHLLALKPVTPPGVSTMKPQVQAQKPRSPQQFIRPAIVPDPSAAINPKQKAVPPISPTLPGATQSVQPAQPIFSPDQFNQPLSPMPASTQPPAGQTGFGSFPTPVWPGQASQTPVMQPIRSVQPVQAAQVVPPIERLSQQGQVSPSSGVPIGQLPLEIVKGRPPLIEANEQFGEEDDNSESYIATSVAAEHWRTSWRNRQRSEAGPATLVSRGQSLVQEPLMAMQNSLIRMRAVILPKKPQTARRFWLTLLLMLCLMAGLLAFIASTFQTRTNLAGQSQSSQQVDFPPPDLRIQGQQTATVAQGQTLILHGENFDAGAPVIFLLDGTLPINGSNGRELVVLASDQGSFDVPVHITSDWSAGPHVIAANDNKNSQSAYLNIIVSLAGPAPTSSPDLSLSVQSVTFHAIMGQGDPQEQFITLTNTNATSPVQWIARAVTDNNLAWLDVDDTTTGGNLGIGGTGTIGIRAMVDGLTNITKPYTGHIIFTINQREQLTLPVQLQLAGSTPEIAINPNPLIGVLSITGDSCQSGATLLLTNLSNEPVSWTLSLDAHSATHIQFLYAGKPYMQGVLAPAGQQGDSKVLTLQCTHVQNGGTYNFTLSSGTLSWPGEVTIRPTL
ncbi:MAG TPA: hypothetical protein VEV19_02445 [Ktedonobacteraceae bacterium]|nr:hypothetical protein [Ktedonobacteraceae bacterium]